MANLKQPFICRDGSEHKKRAAAPKGVLGMRELRPGGLSALRYNCLCAVRSHCSVETITPVLSCLLFLCSVPYFRPADHLPIFP